MQNNTPNNSNSLHLQDTKNLAEFSFYKAPITNTYPERLVSVEDVYQMISTPEYENNTKYLRQIEESKKAKKYKASNFDYVTFSGHGPKRLNAEYTDSGLICCDLDGLPEDNLTYIKDTLMQSQHKPLLMFRSPSGNGLKVVYSIDVTSYTHLDWFTTLSNYFQKTFKINIDKACKDISRACFLCYDPECYYNANSTRLGKEFIERFQPTQRIEIAPKKNTKYNGSIKRSDIIDVAVKMVDNAPDGEKHHTLLKAARLLGGYISGEGICELTAIKALEDAIRPKAEDFEQAQKTIRDGIDYGKTNPIKTEETIQDISYSYQEEDNITTISKSEFAYDSWLFSVKNSGVSLSGVYRDRLIQKLTEFGFYKRYRENNTYIFIREMDNIIEVVEPHNMKDCFFNHVQEIKSHITFDYRGLEVKVSPQKLRETFLKQSHLYFNRNFLEHLPTHSTPIIKDTREKAYFFFKNVVAVVSKEGMTTKSYNEVKEGCIWKNHIIEKEFNYVEKHNNCHFGKFIKNVADQDNDRKVSFGCAIGYMLHNYSDSSKGQAVICYDEEITDLNCPQGGTGKGLFANALKQLRETVKIDGKNFKPDDKFKFQNITDSTQVVWLDDANPKLGFDIFHSTLTDGWTIEKKNKDMFYIKPEDSPKMLISSNSILESKGTTNKRRQFIIEFSNHYSSKIIYGNEEPIIQEHGGMFFDNTDWNAHEWNMFFSYMLESVQFYLTYGLIPYEHKNIARNILRQSTSEDFASWVEDQDFKPGEPYETKQYFEDFKKTYYGEESNFKQRGFTNWIKKYASTMGWTSTIKQSNNISYFTFIEKSI